MAEFSLINQIINTQALSRDDVQEGIGDDCAILKIPENTLLAVSMDTLIEGVHFPESTSAFSLGYKSLAVNLSDLAACGAKPAWATLSISMPEEDKTWLEEFIHGFYSLANDFNVQLVGGDTTRGKLSITVQVHGFVEQPMLRSGAKVGDKIYVTGYLGDAALGFKTFTADDTKDTQALKRFKRPEPRVGLALSLADIASSCIDISDGLASDLSHICHRSHVGARIELSAIPLSEHFIEYFTGDNLYQLSLGFGDDYELCFTVTTEKQTLLSEISETHQLKLTCIGEIVEGHKLQFFDKDNNEIILKKGFEHFND